MWDWGLGGMGGIRVITLSCAHLNTGCFGKFSALQTVMREIGAREDVIWLSVLSF